jgi:hypothetical protein
MCAFSSNQTIALVGKLLLSMSNPVANCMRAATVAAEEMLVSPMKATVSKSCCIWTRYFALPLSVAQICIEMLIFNLGALRQGRDGEFCALVILAL